MKRQFYRRMSLLCLAGIMACGAALTEKSAAAAVGEIVKGTSEAVKDMATGTAEGVSSFLDNTGKFLDDAAITTAVKARLLEEKDISSTDISVETSKGVVSLSGEVADPVQHKKAEELAKGVAGVKTVVNRLTLKK